jgi:predicted  nucleic acid-binding Zn ribbon protein
MSRVVRDLDHSSLLNVRSSAIPEANSTCLRTGSILIKEKTLQVFLYFPFQPVVHNWFIKGRGMCCPVCGKVHIKKTLLRIEKSSL